MKIAAELYAKALRTGDLEYVESASRRAAAAAMNNGMQEQDAQILQRMLYEAGKASKTGTIMNTSSQFAQWLAQERVNQKMKLAWVCRRTSLSERTVLMTHQIHTGATMNVDTVLKLLHVYGYDLILRKK